MKTSERFLVRQIKESYYTVISAHVVTMPASFLLTIIKSFIKINLKTSAIKCSCYFHRHNLNRFTSCRGIAGVVFIKFNLFFKRLNINPSAIYNVYTCISNIFAASQIRAALQAQFLLKVIHSLNNLKTSAFFIFYCSKHSQCFVAPSVGAASPTLFLSKEFRNLLNII